MTDYGRFLVQGHRPGGAEAPLHLSDPTDAESGPTDAFELQVTLGEMEPEDAFRLALPRSYLRLTAGDLLDRVFSKEESGRDAVRAGFDLRENPDLPEMYEALLDVFRARRSGRCALRLFANSGTEIGPSEGVATHVRGRGPVAEDSGRASVLELNIEQRYTALDYAVGGGHWESTPQALDWLRARTLLYFMDVHAFQLSADPESELDKRLAPIVEGLQDEGAVQLAGDTGTYEIAEEGRQLLADMLSETESHIDRYEVFEDVSYDGDEGVAEFGTGRGDDLRVQVYEAEGLDPLKAVFLRLLYDGFLDAYVDEWREAIHDDAFFDDLLVPVVDRSEVEESAMESIIEAGLTVVEEREEELVRQARKRDLLTRARAE